MRRDFIKLKIWFMRWSFQGSLIPHFYIDQNLISYDVGVY